MGAQTYLQLVNMVKIQFTDSTDLLPQIEAFQDNYNRITSNGHSNLSEDLATFMFHSSLPDSDEATAWQYLNNIAAIANYRLMDIIARFLQEENRQKAMALGQGLSLNKFSTLGKSVQSVAKQTTQCKITGPEGKIQIKRARDKTSPKNRRICLERKRWTKRGRAKRKRKKRHK